MISSLGDWVPRSGPRLEPSSLCLLLRMTGEASLLMVALRLMPRPTVILGREAGGLATTTGLLEGGELSTSCRNTAMSISSPDSSPSLSSSLSGKISRHNLMKLSVTVAWRAGDKRREENVTCTPTPASSPGPPSSRARHLPEGVHPIGGS